MKLTANQKLAALSYRFYQGGLWKPAPGDYYTTSRADLELYQVVSVKDGIIGTRYTEGSDVITEWPEAEFLTAGFGPNRVFVPAWIFSEIEAHPDYHAVDRFAADMKFKLAMKRAQGRGGWDDKATCTAEHLSTLLREHVEKGDPLDVGALAMMLQQRGEAIQKTPLPDALDWGNFEGPKRNVEWKPDWQDLIYTAINFRDDEWNDADEDAGQQIVERLLAAWQLTLASEQITFNNAARLLKERDATRSALKTAIDHIEHMAKFLADQRADYSFESIGEDMPGLKAALAGDPPSRARRAAGALSDPDHLR